MDHLYLPHDSSLQAEDQVSYIGSKKYLDYNFLEFVGVRGYSFLLSTAWALGQDVADGGEAIAPLNLDAFLQEWLFFSFLHEIFDVVARQILNRSLYRHVDFTRHESLTRNNTSPPVSATQRDQVVERKTEDEVWEEPPATHVLCTSSLAALADTWVKGAKARAQDLAEHYKHIVKCVDTVATVLKHLRWRAERDSFQHDLKMAVVIATTTDFVVAMTLKAFEDTKVFRSIPIDQSSWASSGWRESYVERMVSLGWCRHDAMSIGDGRFGLQLMHFCANMRRHGTLRHEACTRQACKANVDSRVPRHKPNCKITNGVCNQYAVDGGLMKEMLLTIQEHGRPLLKMWKAEGRLEISLVRWNGRDKYIALSHLWADGMGNPLSNSLPKCQLESLYSQVLNIPQDWLQRAGNEILLWIDTLCCPAEGGPYQNERVSVLNEMSKIYEQAVFVFVLDGELQKIDHQCLGVLETAFRILTSRWMCRLWTLQEGYLADKVWVQFKNKAFELDQDSVKRMDFDALNVECYWIGRDIMALDGSLRRKQMPDKVDRQLESTFLAFALQGRSVKEPSDEPICIATLLKLNVNQILAVSTKERDCAEKRMRILWTLIQHSIIGIPKSVLFYIGRKLSLEGFHWAPASLLEKDAQSLVGALFAGPAIICATISPAGLITQSEGLLFPLQRHSLRCLQKKSSFKTVDVLRSKMVLLRDSAGRWFAFARPNLDQASESSQQKPLIDDRLKTIGYRNAEERKFIRYAVILRENVIDCSPQSSSSGISLFVAVHECEDKTLHVTAIERLLTTRVIPRHAAIWEVAHQIAGDVRDSDDFKAVDSRDAIRNAIEEPGKLSLPQQDILGVNNQHAQSALYEQNEQSIAEAECSDAERIVQYASQLVRHRVANEPSVNSSLQEMGQNEGFLKDVVIYMLAGMFGMDVEFQPSDQVWCVD